VVKFGRTWKHLASHQLLNSKDKFHQKATNLQEILFAKVIIVLAKKNPVKKQG